MIKTENNTETKIDNKGNFKFNLKGNSKFDLKSNHMNGMCTKLVRNLTFAFMLCMVFSLCGCVGKKQVTLDYGDAESFEAALNEGENLEGKTVRFEVSEIQPDSKLGFNLWAGEHLNFVSEGNPDIKDGETVTVRTKKIGNLLGSWVIKYEKIDNAVVGDSTITADKAGASDDSSSASSTDEESSDTSDASSSSDVDDADSSESSDTYTDEDEGDSGMNGVSSETEETYGSEEEDSEDDIFSSNDSAIEAGTTYTGEDFFDNECFKCIKTARIEDSFGGYSIVIKVKGKEDVTVSSEIVLYGKKEKVLATSEDTIVLTKGKINYIKFYFEKDFKYKQYGIGASVEEENFTIGERNAVRMLKADKSGDYLYLTLKQIKEDVGSFANVKVLFYKGRNIVHTEETSLTTSAEKLKGKGSKDIVKIWVYGVNYDRVDFIYEP